MEVETCYSIYMIKRSEQKKFSPFSVELEREDDGRWIAEIPKLSGVMAYGKTREEAVRRVYSIALRTLADTIEEGGHPPRVVSSLFQYEMAGR